VGAIGRRCFLIIEPIPNSRRVIIADDDRLLDWFAVRIPHLGIDHGWHGRASTIGFGEDGNIIAVLVVSGLDKHNWNAELSIAAEGKNWATRGIISKMLSYPFNQLGVGRVTAICAASNAKAINFCLKVGFKKEGVIRRGMGAEDSIILGMLREEAQRWLA
jgi:RimJ/RimL family protein N-acetyltransferase